MAGRFTRQWMSCALGLLFLGGFMAATVRLRAADVIITATTAIAAPAITIAATVLVESPADLRPPGDTL